MGKINIDVTIVDDDQKDFEKFMENMRSWKKTLSPTDIEAAFDKLLDDAEAPAIKRIEMELVFNAIIMILFPIEEYKEKFEKGEK